MKWYIILLAFTTLSSCVSQTEYDRLKNEKDQLAEHLKTTESKLEEERYGAGKLLSEAKEFFKANDIEMAEQKLDTLLEKHPGKSEAIIAKELLVKVLDKKKIILEDRLWEKTNVSEELADVSEYLNQYPDGRYLAKARQREKVLKQKQMENEYENASSLNSSSAWKRFLENHPDCENKSEIKRKIIQAEVAEIMQGEHGQLPSFTPSYGSFDGSSSVSIKNDTEYTLTIRYSGPDVASIDIPEGATRTVNLASGSYTIAASVNAANVRNYAGTEALRGDYNSSFYITSSLY
jgi:hypothetical protein